MIDYKIILGTTAAVAGFIQYVPYIRDILARRTKPHAFSWFVWGLPCGIVFAAQWVQGGGAGSWATGVTALLCTGIFVLSLFYGEKEITPVDWIGFISALIALALWAATKDPLGSVILITLADVLGFVPTIRKSVKKPRQETLSTYFIGGLKWLIALPALGAFSWTVWLYPVAMIGANWLFIPFVLARRAALAAETP